VESNNIKVKKKKLTWQLFDNIKIPYHHDVHHPQQHLEAAHRHVIDCLFSCVLETMFKEESTE